MCLYTKQEAPKVATEDIECYKVLQKKDSKWITPYRGYPVKFNEVMEAEGRKTDNVLILNEFHEVNEGYFHACANSLGIYNTYRDVETAYKRQGKKIPGFKTFRAIIPKGSNYYVGARGDICSDKLIITEETMG